MARENSLKGFDTFVRGSDVKSPEQVIREYAESRGYEAWNPEDCIEAAAKKGYAFWEQRSWGGHFAAAASHGIIEPAGMFPRKTSNGSKRPGWVRCGRR